MIRLCHQLFFKEIQTENCLNSILNRMDFLANGSGRICPGDHPVARIDHNPNFYSDCGSVEIMTQKYAVPPLILFCIIGNLLNLMIYRLSYFDGSSSVHFLRAKAIANSIFVVSRLFEVIHAWSTVASPFWEPLFWNTRAYIVTISNISGTLSTWLTLMVTVETVLCVMVPFIFRQYCTKKMTFTVLVIATAIASILHSLFLFIRTSVPIANLSYDGQSECYYGYIYYSLDLRSQSYLTLWKIYVIAQMALVIVIPTVAMLVCTVIIVKQFTFKDLGDAFSQRRKCVIRLTVATTMSHLLLEGPATLTHAAAAIDGSEHPHMWCVLTHMNNFLSLLNATIPFFVFFVCSEQFRHMTQMYVMAILHWKDKSQKHAYLLQAGMRPRAFRSTGTGTEVTMAETHLLSKVSHVNSMSSV
ncbi:unnamed protein product, partial [Mesorhabditis belari]|uniref:G-protein coupled receptors family 1 profile domain-containing protein n=1 Tax=Mesorhabditis belari TaxID=2138241 RepID=A0AAF3EKS6_9BILA